MMNFIEACKLTERYAMCPNCGSDTVGNGKGTVDIDTEKGHFKRTCTCGWSVVICDGNGGVRK